MVREEDRGRSRLAFRWAGSHLEKEGAFSGRRAPWRTPTSVWRPIPHAHSYHSGCLTRVHRVTADRRCVRRRAAWLHPPLPAASCRPPPPLERCRHPASAHISRHPARGVCSVRPPRILSTSSGGKMIPKTGTGGVCPGVKSESESPQGRAGAWGQSAETAATTWPRPTTQLHRDGRDATPYSDRHRRDRPATRYRTSATAHTNIRLYVARR